MALGDPEMSSESNPVLAPTYSDWNRFCREKGIGVMRPCPICGAAGQVGADESDDDKPMVAFPGEPSQMRHGTMTQTCENCGYQMVYSMGPFVNWLVAR